MALLGINENRTGKDTWPLPLDSRSQNWRKRLHHLIVCIVNSFLSLSVRDGKPKRSRMMVASTILLVLFLLVSGLCRTKGETRALLDLSYQPRLTTSVVTETLQSTLAQHDTIDSIELDVSYSEMGNKGLAEITNYLASTEGVAISLTARMNRLTPDGVKGILYRLINSEEAKSDDLEKKNSNDQLSTVVSLDLGWNNLHPDEAGSKEFLTSLRKLVECPNCPRQLRLDCCGLGPGACRALGKVRCNQQ